MRKIDLKSFIIGALVMLLILTNLGFRKNKVGRFDTIIVQKIKIVTPNGRLACILGSADEAGAVNVFGRGGKVAIALGSSDGDGWINIFNKLGNEVIALQSNKLSEGALYLFDKNGKLYWDKNGKK
jgi:hypothetical protein